VTPPPKAEAPKTVSNGAVDSSINLMDKYDRERGSAKEKRRAAFLKEGTESLGKPSEEVEGEEETEENHEEAEGETETQEAAGEGGEKDKEKSEGKESIKASRAADRTERSLRKRVRQLEAQLEERPPATTPSLAVDKIRAFASEDPIGFAEYFGLDSAKYNAAMKAGKKLDQAAIDKRLPEFIKAEPDKEKEKLRQDYSALEAKVRDEQGTRVISEHISKGLDGDAGTWSLCKAYGNEAVQKVKGEVRKFVEKQIKKGTIKSAEDFSDEDSIKIMSRCADKVEAEYEKLVEVGAKAKGLGKTKKEEGDRSSGYRGTYRRAASSGSTRKPSRFDNIDEQRKYDLDQERQRETRRKSSRENFVKTGRV